MYPTAMKIEVRSKEMIRPSSPTPENLRNYKLSIMDQLALNFKFTFIYFYDSTAASTSTGAYNNTIDELKKSISKTLSLMYPLAGRVKDDKSTIECNDEGVEFIVAAVAERMCFWLDNPDMERLKELIPSGESAYQPDPVGKPLLVIQVNRFSCGGMAIAPCLSHSIADAPYKATLMNTWAAINCGCAVNGSGFVSDHYRIFPPLTDTSRIELLSRMGAEASAQQREKYAIRRLIFPANAIAKLREDLTIKDTDTGSLRRASLTEALTAHLWAAVVNANPTVNVHTVSCMVNLRRKIDPPMPSNSLGNFAYGPTTNWESTKPGTETVTAVQLVPKIRNCLRAVNNGVTRALYGEGGLVRAVFAGGDETAVPNGDDSKKDNSSSFRLFTTSLCRIPYYEADFGWGKPRWVVSVMRDAATFIDTINGGVELWIGLPEDVMHKLMQNHHFLGYVQGFPKSSL